MKILSSKIHGFIDYAAAAALIVAPFFVLPAGAPVIATLLSVAAGVALIIYSLITDYSVSARKAIPFKLHLLIDFIAGVSFIIAPFVLGFEGVTKFYFLIMGGAVIMVVLLTDSNTQE
ncbi:MAG: hypothetical protein AAF936_12515 [Pseudomonadota bacterium]